MKTIFDGFTLTLTVKPCSELHLLGRNDRFLAFLSAEKHGIVLAALFDYAFEYDSAELFAEKCANAYEMMVEDVILDANKQWNRIKRVVRANLESEEL